MPGNKSIQVGPCARVVCVIILVIARSVSVQIEFEVVYNPVIIQIQNRVSFRPDLDFLVFAAFCQAKACIVAISGIPGNIVLIFILYNGIRNILPNLPIFYNFRTGNIITIPVYILCPENDGVWRVCVGNPFGINGNIICEFLIKYKCFTGRVSARLARCTLIPAAKGISQTKHLIIRSGFLGLISRLHELCRVEGSTVAVFIKDQPVAFRSVYREYHITLNRDLCFIFIDLSVFISGNVGSALLNFPPHECVFVISRGIRHVYRISHRRIVFIRAIADHVSADRNVIFIQVINGVLFNKHSVVSNGVSFMDALSQYSLDIITNILDGHCFEVFVMNIIIRGIHPSEEDRTGRQIAHTGIINDRIKCLGRVIGYIVLLDQHGGDLYTVALKDDIQSCVRTNLHDRINRESVRFKCEAGQLSFCILIEGCRNIFRLPVGIVHQHQLATRIQIQGRTEPYPYVDRFTGTGLPLITVCVVYGNVVPSHFPSCRCRRNTSGTFRCKQHRPFCLSLLLFLLLCFREADPAVSRQNIINTADFSAEAVLRRHFRRHNSLADLHRFGRINDYVCFVCRKD